MLLLSPLRPGSFWLLGAGFFPLVFQALGRGGSEASSSPWIWGRGQTEHGGELLACWVLGERTGQSVPPVGDTLTPLESPRLILWQT